jgi:outer membrane protein OmpA-like peptidoglycan-associated protein
MALRECGVLKVCVLVIGILSLVSCAANSKNNDLSHSQAQAFPDIKKARIKEGIYINSENIKRIEVGMSKQQVYSLIGKPHFNEGFVGVRLWNYIVNYKEDDGRVIGCQYQLAYDKNFLVEDIVWKDDACKEKILNANKLHSIAPQPISDATPHIDPPDFLRTVEVLSDDVYFPFGKSSRKDLPAKTYDQLYLFWAKVNERIKKVHDIRITGHADIIGNANHNLSLSISRAETIKDLAIGMGINPYLIQTNGYGSQMPIKNCLANQHLASLIACGQPNRRVNITVSGEAHTVGQTR